MASHSMISAILPLSAPCNRGATVCVLVALLAAAGCSSLPRSVPPTTQAACPPTQDSASTQPQPSLSWSTALRVSSFDAMAGWAEDDPREAWSALQRSCSGLRSQRAWDAVCTAVSSVDGTNQEAVRAFFESLFTPYQVINLDGTTEGTVTGYYEPIIRGSRRPSPAYSFPIYGVPDDLLVVDLSAVYPELKHLRLRGRLEGRRVVPYYTRAEIGNGKAAVRGRELIWTDDPVELFFLQVQGSGRVQLDTGETVRLSYADQNGHPYRSLGRQLVEQGELTLDQASMQGIKGWAARNPERLVQALNSNASYVFFHETPASTDGPTGALGVPLTAGRSLAVDPRAIPLGAPVFLSTTWPNSSLPLRRLMFAQDTGGAIKGAVRADYFWGSGDEAGVSAGRMRQTGQMWVLLPRDFPLTQPANGQTSTQP